MTCQCGKPVPEGTLQCPTCRKAAVAKLMKIAAILGALLGFACSRLPEDFQGPCKAVAAVLTACQ